MGEHTSRNPRLMQDASFDPSSAFLFRPGGGPNALAAWIEDDLTSTVGASAAALDEEQLIRAAREELKRKKSRSREGLDRAGKADLAGKLLTAGDDDGGDGYAERVAKLFKEKAGGVPTVEIEYNNVCIETDALVGASSNPSVMNSMKDLMNKILFQKGSNTKPMHILDGVSGVIKPGRFTLVLGPPGAGKSVFLQLLSGRLRMHKGLRMQGNVRYNGEDIHDFVVQRTAGLVDQYDRHLPNLTTLETVKFSFDCQMNRRTAAEFLAAIRIMQHSKNMDHGGNHDGQDAWGSDKRDVDMEEGRIKNGVDRHTGNIPNPSGLRVPSKTVAGRSSSVDNVENAVQASVDSVSGAGMSDDDFYRLLEEGIINKLRPYIVLHLLGLQDVMDTLVGGDNVRGLSGGQRKRVTSAEVFVGPQWALFCDEISTGLDSATTFSVIKSLRNFCHALNRTIIISLLQPPPEVVQLFDDIILLVEGKVIFHGPVSEAVPFYASMGFDCPPRKDHASFLQEVTTPVGQLLYASDSLLERHNIDPSMRDPTKMLADPPKKLLVPLEDFETAFWQSNYGQTMRHQLDHAPVEAARTNPTALSRTRYARSGLALAMVTMKRQFLLLKRGRAFYIARSIQSIVMALIISSLFATVSPKDGSLLDQGRKALALCVLSIIYLSMSSFPSLTFVYATKDVFFKQRDAYMYPPWTYVVSLLAAQVPSATAEAILFSVCLYFISGLTRTAGHFFTFLLVTWSAANSLAGLFRLIAYFSPSMILANAIGSLLLLFMTITNGFSIVRTSIPPYLIWVYYINPLAWGVRSLCINELTAARWGVSGEAILETFGFFTNTSWIWGGVGYLWVFLFIVTLLGVFVLNVAPAPVPRPMVDEEDQKKAMNQNISDYIKRRKGLRRRPTLPAMGIKKAVKNVSSRLAVSASKHDLKPSPSSPPADSIQVMPIQEERGSTHGATSPLNFIPVTLVCRNICYYVNDPSSGLAPGVVKDSSDREIAGKLQLLQHIDFYSEPGCLTALMGGSGAGKTTLMDVVAGRKTQGIIRGDIIVNRRPKDQNVWARTVGYVEQQDLHSTCVTVLESLHFSARLRLDSSLYDDAAVSDMVEEVLQTVELKNLAHRLVGDPGGHGLSIEQRKRLSIAVELVANPSVLFMDEPTSGLDARAAAIVMRAVRSVADGQRCCLVTIHQPSMDIFESFDSLVLLQRGGKLTYFGPLGHESHELVAYLEAFPGVEPIRPGYNPATWMLEVTGGSMTTTFKTADVDFPEEYAASELRAANLKKMEEISSPKEDINAPAVSTDPENIDASFMEAVKRASLKRYATPMSTQARELLKKYFSYYWHAPQYNFVRILVTLGIALIYGLTYLNEAKKIRPGASDAGVDTVQNVLGLIFSLAIFNGMFNCMTVMPVVSGERMVFYRERASAYYAPRMLSMAQGFAEIPYLAVQAVLMVSITYWMVGFIASAWKFFYFLLVFFLTVTLYTFMGQFLVIATPNQMLAQLLAAALNQMFTIFNGFLVTYDQTPVGWKWMNRVSPTTWVLYGLGGSQLADSNVPLVPSQSSISSASGAVPAETVGEFTQQFFGYSPGFIWWCPLIIFAYIIFFRLGTGLMLSFVNYQKR